MTVPVSDSALTLRRHADRVVYSVEELVSIAELEPANPMPRYLLAMALRRRGDPDWQQHVDLALALPHLTPQHTYARALVKIERGEWEGWTDYNARLAAPDTIEDLGKYRELCWKHRAWDGTEDLADKSILVLPEQGFGDCLQMWRFIPPLTEIAGSVIAMVYPRLVALARHNFGSHAKIWLDGIKPTATFDRYVWSMSLPAALGRLPHFTTIATPRRRPKLPPRTRPIRAGVCWAGNPDYTQDPDRSMPIGALTPLLLRDDVEWYSLQVGERAADANDYDALLNPDPPLVTYSDTADLMMELDYVITVDTSVCHLAGNLGVPTWLLLQYDSHWRWGLADVTPWYPMMRLIRQQGPRDWASSVAQVNALLDENYAEAAVPA
jgi:hypothetical protein